MRKKELKKETDEKRNPTKKRKKNKIIRKTRKNKKGR